MRLIGRSAYGVHLPDNQLKSAAAHGGAGARDHGSAAVAHSLRAQPAVSVGGPGHRLPIIRERELLDVVRPWWSLMDGAGAAGHAAARRS